MVLFNNSKNYSREMNNPDEYLSDVNLKGSSNPYIEDETKSLELISDIIRNETKSKIDVHKDIEKGINKIFSLFSDVSIKGELQLYKDFMYLCSKLSEIHKIKKINDKVVISFGGQMSAGKSKFINSISQIGDLLPVDQDATTAIPTYIVKSNKKKITANSIYGYTNELDDDALQALAHAFNNKYEIGFSAFVESIIIESDTFSLDSEIALLDTPGYTKFDGGSNSKKVISDEQRAFQQLSITDYLIWLIDIENGELVSSDIQFIKELNIQTPILIVLTKSDKVTNEIKYEVIDKIKETVKENDINCFGVTAYSSTENEEFNNNLIEKFMDMTVQSNVRNNNLIGEFIRLEKELRSRIEEAQAQSIDISKELFMKIKNSNDVIQAQSLTSVWGEANQERYKLEMLLKSYDDLVTRVNVKLKKYISEGNENI